MSNSTYNLTEIISTLESGKMYYRQLEYAGEKYKHKVGTPIEDESGFYRNGIEIFKFKEGKYILRAYTGWNKEVLIDREIIFDKDMNVSKSKFNAFGMSYKKLKDEPNPAYDGKIGLDEYFTAIFGDWVEDEERRLIIKDNPLYTKSNSKQ